MASFDSDVSPCAVGMIDTVTAARAHPHLFLTALCSGVEETARHVGAEVGERVAGAEHVLGPLGCDRIGVFARNGRATADVVARGPEPDLDELDDVI